MKEYFCNLKLKYQCKFFENNSFGMRRFHFIKSVEWIFKWIHQQKLKPSSRMSYSFKTINNIWHHETLKALVFVFTFRSLSYQLQLPPVVDFDLIYSNRLIVSIINDSDKIAPPAAVYGSVVNGDCWIKTWENPVAYLSSTALSWARRVCKKVS